MTPPTSNTHKPSDHFKALMVTRWPGIEFCGEKVNRRQHLSVTQFKVLCTAGCHVHAKDKIPGVLLVAQELTLTTNTSLKTNTQFRKQIMILT